jgi:hypothetical protein
MPSNSNRQTQARRVDTIFIRRDYVGINTTLIKEKNTNMASADDSSGIPSLPAPVPPRGNDGQRPIEQSLALFAGGNRSPTAAATDKHNGASTTRLVLK